MSEASFNMPQNLAANQTGSVPRKVTRALNVPFLIGSLAVMGVVALSAFGIRWWQVSRSAEAFLQRADQYEKESKWFEAAEYINRYLQLEPNAGQERVHLANTFAKGANTYLQRQRAIDLLYRALGAEVAEAEVSLRKQVGDFLLQNGRYVEAEAEAAKLLAIAPKGSAEEAAGLRVRALGLVRQYQTGALAREKSDTLKIIDTLADAQRRNPGDLVLAELLAKAYLDEKLVRREIPDKDKETRTSLANACMDDLIKARSNDPQAYLVRFRYRVEQSRGDAVLISKEAIEDLEQAIKWGPKDATVLMVAAQTARSESRRILSASGSPDESKLQLQRAHDLYQRIVTEKLAPNNPVPNVALGETLLELRKEDEAIAVWRAGLGIFKKNPGVFHAHLADLWLDQGKLVEAEASLKAIQTEIDQLPPNTDRQSRLEVERDQFLRQSIWHVKREETRQALPLLQKVVLRQEQLGGDSLQSTRALLLLGSALGALGDWNASAVAFDRAALQQPKLAAAKTAASASWLAANRPDLAVDRAEQAVRLEQEVRQNVTSKTWYMLAAACFQQQLLLPSEERAWGRFEKAIENAKIDDGTFDEPWRVDLLKADYILASTFGSKSSEEGQRQALDVLRLAESKYPEINAFWQAIPLIYQRLGQPADADRSLKHFSALSNVGLQPSLIQARLLTLRGQYDLAEKSLQDAAKDDPIEIQRELINLKLARRDFVSAHKMLEQLHRLYPKDLAILRRLADIDLENGKLDQVAKWESAMQLSEGAGQILSIYFRIRRLILQASSATDPLLEQAAAEQAKLVGLRPNWAEAVALRGVIDQRRGRLESAISAYEEAISLGEQRVLIFEQLMLLLEKDNRLADAEKYLSRLRSHIPLSQGLTVFESTVEIRRNQPEKAVEVARLGVDRRPNDPAAHIWLGKTLLVQKKPEEAEKEFESAVDLQPEDVRNWNSLFSFYLQIGNKEKGRLTLTRMAKKAKLSGAERSFVLAQGYELLGDQALAIAEYKNAAKLAPNNTAILLRMAGYYLRNSPDEAEECLKDILKIDRTSGVARRTLAALLAARGKDADWAEVEKLLGAPTANQGSSTQDNRLRAVLLMQRGGEENLRRATEILEELVARSDNQVLSDRLMLAQLYERLSRLTSDAANPQNTEGRTSPEQYLTLCHDQFIALCTRPAPQPSHLVAFVEFLLRHEELKGKVGDWLDTFDELLKAAAQPSPVLIAEYVRLRLAQGDRAAAEKWQARLEESQPDALPTIALRARLMVKQDKRNEVGPFVEAAAKRLLEKVKDDKQRAVLFQGIGRLYASNEMYAEAESWYRKLYVQEPGTFEPLVGVLTQQGRTMEAIQICDEATKTDKSLQGALIAVSVLASGKAAAMEAKQAEELISSALKRHPKDVRLLFNVATLRVMQGQTDDAEKLFRYVVDINPKHVIALNNLATLLSEQPGQRKEALRLIDQAIKISGSEAALFDTKGTILLFDNQSDKAIEFLKVAASGPDSDPRYRFHLALAYKGVNQIENARNELKQADQNNLDKQILTPTEQKMLSELRSILTP